MKTAKTIPSLRLMIRAALLLLPLIAAAPLPARAAAESRSVNLFTVVTDSRSETQFMALILSLQAVRQGAEVRILLCDEAGELALRAGASPPVQPSGRSPRELLEELVAAGVTVEVCAIFLPNRGLAADDLIAGVGIARPDQIAEFMLRENIRFFTF